MLSYQFIQLWSLGHDFNPLTYDFGDDYENNLALLSKNLDAKDPDISAYLSRGGKLMMFAGTTDAVVPYGGTIDYVRAVRETVAEEHLNNFAFFIFPTIDHGAAAAQPAVVTCREDGGTVLEAMRAWVEKGEKPTELYVNAVCESGEKVKVRVKNS